MKPMPAPAMDSASSEPRCESIASGGPNVMIMLTLDGQPSRTSSRTSSSALPWTSSSGCFSMSVRMSLTAAFCCSSTSATGALPLTFWPFMWRAALSSLIISDVQCM